MSPTAKPDTTLFKYCHPRLIEDVLEKRTLRFTPPSALNDPFDCLPRIMFQESDLERLTQSPRMGQLGRAWAARLKAQGRWSLPVPSDDEMRRSIGIWQRIVRAPAFVEALVHGRLEEIGLGVLSMSADGQHPLMWSHYADSHRGFVVEFDDLGLQFREVSYEEKRVQQPFAECYKKDVFLTKSSHWQHEQERRAFVPVGDPRLISRGALTLLRYEFENLKSITLGYRMDLASCERIRKLYSGRDVKLYESDLNPEEYVVERTEWPRRE
jgi:hypothetical protein